jgi:hypothetical protein
MEFRIFDHFVGAQQEYLRRWRAAGIPPAAAEVFGELHQYPLFLILWLSKYLAPAALGVSQALSSFDPAIINLPSLENCERIVALAQSGLEL